MSSTSTDMHGEQPGWNGGQWTCSVTAAACPFRLPLPLTSQPREYPSYTPWFNRACAFRAEMDMTEKGAAETIRGQALAFYCRLFLTGKVTGGWKPMIEMETLFLVITSYSRWTVRTRTFRFLSIQNQDHTCALWLMG